MNTHNEGNGHQMADYEGHGRALRALAALEQDAIARARAEGERARAEAASRREAQPAELSYRLLGPYQAPSAGEIQVAAAIVGGLDELGSRRWPLTIPLMGGGR